MFLISLFERREKLKTYFSLIINECIKIGYDSLFIVSIVSIFMGAVTTIQTAFNLVGPLIPDYVISLVVRDMTLLELSPTIILTPKSNFLLPNDFSLKFLFFKL